MGSELPAPSKEYIVDVPDLLILKLKESMNRGAIHELYDDGSESGIVIKYMVDRFMGLKVEIFSNEHPPPHFRVKYQSSTANFSIEDCSLLNGSGEVLKYEKNVLKWWKQNKQQLITIWNERRPSGCPVGEYQE